MARVPFHIRSARPRPPTPGSGRIDATPSVEADPTKERLLVRLTLAEKAWVDDLSYRADFHEGDHETLERLLLDLVNKNGGHYDVRRHRRGENVELLVIDAVSEV